MGVDLLSICQPCFHFLFTLAAPYFHAITSRKGLAIGANWNSSPLGLSICLAVAHLQQVRCGGPMKSGRKRSRCQQWPAPPLRGQLSAFTPGIPDGVDHPAYCQRAGGQYAKGQGHHQHAYPQLPPVSSCCKSIGH